MTTKEKEGPAVVAKLGHYCPHCVEQAGKEPEQPKHGPPTAYPLPRPITLHLSKAAQREGKEELECPNCGCRFPVSKGDREVEATKPSKK